MKTLINSSLSGHNKITTTYITPLEITIGVMAFGVEGGPTHQQWNCQHKHLKYLMQ